jgi:hypothetical protein
MLDDILSTAILALVVLLAVLLISPVLSRIIGYGFTQGAQRAQRDPVKAVAPYERVAQLGTGGLCMAGHWVEGGHRNCHMGHAYSGPRSRGANLRDIAQARRAHEDSIRGATVPLAIVPTEDTLQRFSAGGW